MKGNGKCPFFGKLIYGLDGRFSEIEGNCGLMFAIAQCPHVGEKVQRLESCKRSETTASKMVIAKLLATIEVPTV